MKKMFGRILIFCGVLVLILATVAGAHPLTYIYNEYGCYGTESFPLEYPITRRMVDVFEWHNSTDYNAYVHWWDSFKPKNDTSQMQRIEYMGTLWNCHYYVDSPEKTPQVYLDLFEERIADAVTKVSPIDNSVSALRIEGYSWNGDVLSVECRGDYSLSRHRYEGDSGEIYYDFHVNIGDVDVAVALTNKSDGKLAFVARTGEKVTLKIPDGTAYKEKDYGDYVGALYIWTATETIEIKMPEMFDPELHDIKLYFEQFDDEKMFPTYYAGAFWYIAPAYPVSDEGYSKPEPAPEPDPEPDPEPQPIMGDVNGDGVVNLADASFTLKYISGWGIEIDIAAANMNGDSGVNLVDVSRILKLIAGWEN